MKALVEDYVEQGAFANEEAARAWLNHMTTVERFEQQGNMGKVVEHMESLYHLLDHQQENDLISEDAYHTLKEDVDTFMMQWQ
ncbi:FIMAH domain-containing protein [Geomicrobium halophilum]|uniref:FIMAH domain-containing protein n=1 Tax=Geomicrobium halophilum TaxID=549000 RepID=UPI003CCCFBA0